MLKKFPAVLIVVFMTVFLLSACSFPTRQSETTDATETPELIPETGAVEQDNLPGVVPQVIEAEQNNLPERISQVIGAEVRDGENQAVGEVVEVILNRYGLPEYMVIASGDRFIPAPRSAFSWNESAGQAVYQLDRNILERAPSFTGVDDFPDLYSNAWDQEIIGHWIEQVELPGATDRMPTSNLVPKKVTLALESQAVDFEGEAIGPVEEVLFNQAEERGYAVIRVGEQFVPVPWDEFDWDPVNSRLIYLYENERLQNAPRFGGLQELDTPQPDWDREINQYWRTP